MVTRPIYNNFNVGLMLLVIAISILLGLGISIPKLIDGFKRPQVQNE